MSSSADFSPFTSVSRGARSESLSSINSLGSAAFQEDLRVIPEQLQKLKARVSETQIFENREDLEKLFQLKTFEDLDKFFKNTTIRTTAEILQEVKGFLKLNLEYLDPGFEFSEEALCVFLETLLGDRMQFRRINSGGEGTVYSGVSTPSLSESSRDERLYMGGRPHSVNLPEERIHSATLLTSRAQSASLFAYKVLNDGCYAKDHKEIKMARRMSKRRHSGVLRVDCVRSITPSSTKSSSPVTALVMRLGEESVREYMSREPSLKNRLIMILKVAEQVSKLHHSETPLVHKDLKPENAMVLFSKEVRLIDFSFGASANVTKVKREPSTLVYSSPPESLVRQDESEKEDMMTVKTSFDLWSLGTMLYESIVNSKAVFGNFAAFIYLVGTNTYFKKLFADPTELSQEIIDKINDDYRGFEKEQREEKASAFIKASKEAIKSQAKAQNRDGEDSVEAEGVSLENSDELMKNVLAQCEVFLRDYTMSELISLLVNAREMIEKVPEDKQAALQEKYMAQNMKASAILEKEPANISIEDLKFLQKFFKKYAPAHNTTEGTYIEIINEMLSKAVTMKVFEKFPELKEMVQTLMAYKPEDRKDVNDFIAAMHKFLTTHPELD